MNFRIDLENLENPVILSHNARKCDTRAQTTSLSRNPMDFKRA